jgi:hypothetical protein
MDAVGGLWAAYGNAVLIFVVDVVCRLLRSSSGKLKICFKPAYPLLSKKG